MTTEKNHRPPVEMITAQRLLQRYGDQLVGVKTKHLVRATDCGRFPRYAKLAGGAIYFAKTEVEAFFAAKQAVKPTLRFGPGDGGAQ